MVTCATLFTACKKDKQKTTAEKVLGKWSVTNSVENNNYNNTPHISTYRGTPTDYADFRAGNKIYLKDGVDVYTLSYSVSSDNKLTIDGEVAEIKTITDNLLFFI